MTTFNAVPTRSTRLRVVFSDPMQKNSALLNRVNYAVTDMNGTSIGVLSVTAEQATSVTSIVLDLGIALSGGKLYQLLIRSALIVSDTGGAVSPTTGVFRWVEGALSAQIPVSQFSGEAVGGLYGDHTGVFFSPALENPARNSIIQVDQVDVCTRADDTYQMPAQSESFRGLMVHGYRSDGVLIPARPVPATVLNSSDVLWLPAARVAVGYGVGMRLTDTVPAPVDGVATATLVSWPPGRLALLNNSGWKLFDNLPGTAFITADNFTPLSPQPPVTRTL